MSWSGSTASTSAALRHQRHRLAVHRDRRRLRLRLGRAAHDPAQPGRRHATTLVNRVASELAAPAGGSRRVITDNGSEFRSHELTDRLDELGIEQRRIRAGRHLERPRRAAPLTTRGMRRLVPLLVPKLTAPNATSSTTSATTTTTEPTPADSPKAESPERSSTVPTRCEPPYERPSLQLGDRTI